MRIDTFTAISLNGMIAEKNNRSTRIFRKFSTRKLLKLREKIRNQYDAILVGANTLIKDNPNLLNSMSNNRRLIIDKYYNLPLDLKIFKNKPENTIIILVEKETYKFYFKKIKKVGANLLFLDNLNNPKKIIKKVEETGIKSILVEGGAKTISEFLKNHLIDNVQLIIFPFLLNKTGVNLFSGQIFFGKFKLFSSKIIDKKFVFLKLGAK